jgi:hypothetical protein
MLLQEEWPCVIILEKVGEKLRRVEVSGSHGDGYEDVCLLGCCASIVKVMWRQQAPRKRRSISTKRLHGAAPHKRAILKN